MEPTKVFVDWKTMHTACSVLSNAILIQKHLKKDFTIDAIVALSRGGLTPAVCMSHMLCPVIADNLKVYCLGVASYKAEQKTKPELYQTINPKEIVGKSILLVDDLVDTGESLRDAKEFLLLNGASNVTTAVLHEKECTLFIPDFKAFTTKHNVWVVYPWEVMESCAKSSTDQIA